MRRLGWMTISGLVVLATAGGVQIEAAPGGTPGEAALSCKAILTAGFSSGDGLYWPPS